jgi:hypothetical protein
MVSEEMLKADAHSPLKMAALTKNRNFLNIAITSSFGNELFNIYAVFVL